MVRPPPRSGSLARRAALQRSFLSLFATSAILPAAIRTLPASAAKYTVVPSGTVAEKEARLSEVEKLFLENPDDPYIFGERAQLNYDLKQLRTNRDFAGALSSDVAAGLRVFPTTFSVPVTDINLAVNFWRGGLGALVTDSRLVNGVNVTTVSFGSGSLKDDDGAKFALELVEQKPGERLPLNPDGSVPSSALVQYIQLSMPVFRISQVMAYGGEIKSAYGWTELVAPGGLPLRVRIDEQRRDPFEFVALRTSSLKASIKRYEALGMTAAAPRGARKLKLSGSTVFENSDAFEPDREVGSVLMSYGDAKLSTGLLLLPPKSRDALLVSSPPPQLRVVGVQPSEIAATSSGAGDLPVVFDPLPAYEANCASRVFQP